MTTLATLLVGVDIDADQIERSSGKAAKAALAVGVAAGVAVGAGLNEAINMDAANDKLAAQLGASSAESKRLGKVAGDLYAGAWGDSLEEVNSALRGVIQNVGGMADASDAELQGVTASVIDVGKTFDQDLGEVTRSVGKLMKTGLAKDATDALDILTRGFQTGGDEAGDLLEVVNEYSTLFREVGLSGEQAMGLISQGLDAGARDADKVADSIKEFSIRAKDGSDLTSEGFKTLGLDAGQMAADVAAGGDRSAAALDATLDALRAMEDPVARDAAAVALFGTQAEDLGDALFALDPSGATDSLGQVTGAAERMGDTLNDNARTNITSFMRQAKLAFVNVLGNQVLPVVEDVARFLAVNFGPALSTVAGIVSGTVLPALGSLGRFVRDNETPIKIVAGLIATLFIPHLIALGVAATVARVRVVAAWALMRAGAIRAAVVHSAQIVRMVAMWVLLGVQSLLHAAKVAAAWLIAMGPIGLVIAAVVALVALIIKNWDTIKKVTVRVWNAVVDFVKKAPGRIMSGIRSLLGSIGRFFRDVWNAGREATVDRVNSVVSFVKGIPGKIMSGVRSLIGSIRRFFRDVWNAGREATVERFHSIRRFVEGIPGRIKDALGDLGSLLWNAGRDIINGLIDGIRSREPRVGGVMNGVINAITRQFPFSPAKEGPLRSHPPELAGGNVGALFAGGLAAAERDVVAAAERLTAAAAINPDVLVGSGFDGVTLRGVAVPEGRGDGTLRVESTGGDNAFATAFEGMLRDGTIRLVVDDREVEVG